MAQSGLPLTGHKQLRLDFERWMNGWDTRMDGGARRPPSVWNVKEAALFCEGWDAADRREALVDALLATMEGTP